MTDLQRQTIINLAMELSCVDEAAWDQGLVHLGAYIDGCLSELDSEWRRRRAEAAEFRKTMTPEDDRAGVNLLQRLGLVETRKVERRI